MPLVYKVLQLRTPKGWFKISSHVRLSHQHLILEMWFWVFLGFQKNLDSIQIFSLMTIRNFTILSIALQCPRNEAADIILHIWYSVQILVAASRARSTYVLPLVEAVTPKIKGQVIDDCTFENLKIWDPEPRFIASQKAITSVGSEASSLVRCRKPNNRIESACSHASNDKAISCGSSNSDTAKDIANAQCGFEKLVCFCRFLAILDRTRFRIRRARVFAHSLNINGHRRTLFDNEGDWLLHNFSDPLEG